MSLAEFEITHIMLAYFPRACLSIGKQGTVVAVPSVIENVDSKNLMNIILIRKILVCRVEGIEGIVERETTFFALCINDGRRWTIHSDD